MSILDALEITVVVCRTAYNLACALRDSELANNEIKQAIISLSHDLSLVINTLAQLRIFAYRLSVTDEAFMITNINSLQTVIENAQHVMEDMQRNRSFFERLLINSDDYKRQIQDIRARLSKTCQIVQGSIAIVNKVVIPSSKFSSFRQQFANAGEKSLYFYEFPIERNAPESIVKIDIEEFDASTSSYYMKINNEQLFLSYHLRTWFAQSPNSAAVAERLKRFQKSWKLKNEHAGLSNNSLSSSTSPTSTSLPVLPSAKTTTASPVEKQKVIGQYGTEGNGPDKFIHIAYLYIPKNDEKKLFVVDRGQGCVHQYKIHDTGHHIEYVHRYIVIANVIHKIDLLSYVIHNQVLLVSDTANNCLHIFRLGQDRQSSFLIDDSLLPFSPGLLCVHDQYLYVAEHSLDNSSILVFNKEYEVIDWFRNDLLNKILAMDIDRNINELYILTTTSDINSKKKRPLIVSMDMVVRCQKKV